MGVSEGAEVSAGNGRVGVSEGGEWERVGEGGE